MRYGRSFWCFRLLLSGYWFIILSRFTKTLAGIDLQLHIRHQHSTMKADFGLVIIAAPNPWFLPYGLSGEKIIFKHRRCEQIFERDLSLTTFKAVKQER